MLLDPTVQAKHDETFQLERTELDELLDWIWDNTSIEKETRRSPPLDTFCVGTINPGNPRGRKNNFIDTKGIEVEGLRHWNL